MYDVLEIHVIKKKVRKNQTKKKRNKEKISFTTLMKLTNSKHAQT